MKVRNDQESNESIPQIKITIGLDQASHTPLMIASGEGKFQTAMELVQSGADVNAMSLLNSTAVQFAAQQGHFKIVQFLAEQGADLNHKNLVGWNTFIYAAGGNNLNLVKWLIEERKLSINADDVNTALLFAAKSKNLNILYFIFKNFRKLAGDNKKIRSMGKNPYVKIGLPLNDLDLNYGRDLVLLENNELEQLDLNVQSSIAKLMIERLPKATSLKKLIYRHEVDNLKNLLQFFNTSALEELKFISDSVTPITADLLTQITNTLLNNQNSKLKILDLRHCKIGIEGSKALSNLIEQSLTLECLNLAHCELGDGAIKLIIESINHKTTPLHTLDLAYNQIGIKSAQILASFLENPMCTLQSLNISANSNITEGIILIADAMKKNSSVSFLNLSNIYPKHDECVVALSEMIASNKVLISLNLKNNNFTDTHGVMIANGLKKNSSIKEIELGSHSGGSSFDVESAKAFGQMLKYNTALKKISLSEHKNLGNGMKYIASGLSYNNSLIKLDLSDTSIDDVGSTHLRDALSYYNCTLQDMGGYKKNIQEIDVLLNRNKTLASDDLNAFELKKILDEIRRARWKSGMHLQNQPYSLRFMLGFWSDKIPDLNLREVIINNIRCTDKNEITDSFLKCK